VGAEMLGISRDRERGLGRGFEQQVALGLEISPLLVALADEVIE
jgi:hypothetical protein